MVIFNDFHLVAQCFELLGDRFLHVRVGMHVVDSVGQRSTGSKIDEIKDAFKAEWDKRADLREQMQFLTGNEDACPSKDFLKAIKAEFKEVGKLHPGGRPKKNP